MGISVIFTSWHVSFASLAWSCVSSINPNNIRIQGFGRWGEKQPAWWGVKKWSGWGRNYNPIFGPADPQIRNKAKSRRLKLDQVDYREGALQLLFDKLFSENDWSLLLKYMGPKSFWYQILGQKMFLLPLNHEWLITFVVKLVAKWHSWGNRATTIPFWAPMTPFLVRAKLEG